MTTPRGIANNNPGNIDREPGTVWLGQSAAQRDPRFVQFRTPAYGLRALAKLLLTYQAKHACHTPRQIIARWAPSVENKTAAYLADVCARTGLHPDEPVDLRKAALCVPFVRAIVQHECGQDPYPASVVGFAADLAGCS